MTINSTRRGKGDEVIFLQLSWYLHHFFPLPSPAPSPCSGNSLSQTLGSCCGLCMPPWAPPGVLESIARWPECSHLAPGSIPASAWICGMALCKPVHGPVQTSASSMTPVLHPRNNFQEPAQTHFLLRSTAKETPQEQCPEEGMLQTQQ